jgi:heterodisulfide reductase subunit A-like polyferredoxin
MGTIEMNANNEVLKQPVGAALVIGGGIAGIQAALDLAESGIKVYLVEKAPAIGGHMAQLDKTFPTNDCAMCIVSPKLVEAGRHRNIELLTNSDVLALEGQPGDFTVTVRRRPRYIDPAKCTACADCERACPVDIPSEFNAGLATRRAAYKLYPQAVPNTFAIDKKGRSPCKATCPAETSAQGYVALISAGRYEDALEVIKQYNPFPACVGRVCTHPCESECNRGLVDGPVAICHLKRFVADRLAGQPVPVPERKYSEQVAVVGSGPAGLSCAHHLARLGYGVTVFEALPVAGGMMRVGIPAYRLPRDVLEREIADIQAEGVEIRLNQTVSDLNSLFDQGYAAIFLAVGAHQPQELGIPGERGTSGVHHGVAFLRRVSLGEAVALGQRVVVVGGGNTAIDTARTALRLGAKEVTLVYRRTRAEMPAHAREVDEAEVEGVRLLLLAAPVEVITDDGHVAGVKCVRMRLGEPDASGRPRPIPIPGSEFVIEADALVAAVAQAPEISLLRPDHGLHITRQGTFAVDPETMATNRPGIFAGGDSAQGPGALIEAIASGRRGGLSIHRYLRGLPLRTPREEAPPPKVKLTPAEVEAKIAAGEALPIGRAEMPTLPVEVRLGSFVEVELGYTEEQAKAEALRCLSCGVCSECYQCVKACKPGAVTVETHEQIARQEQLRVGAVILAPGYSPYDARLSEEFGYGRYANVVTSLQFERLLSASGPTQGHVLRQSDGQPPKKIAFLQCIGSRDQKHDYCSAVCCMYATKEAMLALEHVPGVECQVFMMDMRAFGKGFDAYYERAKRQGIKYTRCRISALKDDPVTHKLIIRHEIADSSANLQSPISDLKLLEEEFDLVVLSVGLEAASGAGDLAQRLDVRLRPDGFCWTDPFSPVATSREGVYVCGAFSEPKDIPDSVVQGSGAAAAALRVLAPARGTLVSEKIYPPEIVLDKAPRVGVFVCSCGSNIAGVVDVQSVTAYAQGLPDVVHAENTIYTCAADSLKLIQERVAELGLNRVVVASCTPRTHEPLFQDTIREAGLNEFLFEMANIRDQCSWVHSTVPTLATAKAKELVRMSVARARLLEPLHKMPLSLQHSALVVGGGVAGMTAALSLADQGFPVTLVERSPELGGWARKLSASVSGDPTQFVQSLIERVRTHERIEVLTNTVVVEAKGFVGNFQTLLRGLNDPRQRLIEHGATIIATGAQEYRGPEFGLGQDPRIVTQGDLEEICKSADRQITDLQITNLQITNQQSESGKRQSGPRTAPRLGAIPNRVVMIQCVGPWGKEEFYCSRLCCAVALKNALRLKELNPATQVTILYKDMRTYGFKESLYTQARAAGVLFVRYDDDHKPQVEISNLKSQIGNPQSAIGNPIVVRAWDPVLGEPLVLRPDLLVLSEAIVPAEGSEELARTFKFSCSREGFFLEAHVKLRPVDFPAEGIFLCGTAHYPKFLDEAVTQAQAAAARAATILSKDELQVGGVVAEVEQAKCTACLTCVRICPFDVPVIDPAAVGAGGIRGAARIEVAACRGCGICAAECPAKAIELLHFKDGQVITKVEALFAERELVAA